MSAVYLSQFDVIKPKNCVDQAQLLNWLSDLHQGAQAGNSMSNQEKLSPSTIDNLVHRYGVKPSQISQRFLESDDRFNDQVCFDKVHSTAQDQPNQYADIGQRTDFYGKRALEVMHSLYSEQTRKPDHLIHVTCTGYASPSAAQRIVALPSWQGTTDITHAYHMGCYAAVPAIRMARALAQSGADDKPDEPYTVDIVHNEICSLHLDKNTTTPEQIVVQSLFADGHIKYSASTQVHPGVQSLKMVAIHEQLVPSTHTSMGWQPQSWGMQINLSRGIPDKIRVGIDSFSAALYRKAKLNQDDIDRAIFAIHPGGPKIIDSVQEALALNDSQVAHSRAVLRTRGNMSSATLPHVWAQIVDDQLSAGTHIISYAFGPGLTLFGAVFEVV
jgi:predicted naringenin-chalcone synthase